MKEIKNYPDYFVAENGDVYSKKYGELRKLKLGKDNHGYHQLNLYKDGKRKTYKLHRLVALTFIPNPDNLPSIDHINGNKLDNRVENLEWVTNQENMKRAGENDLMQKGEKHYNVKLTEEQVKWIRNNYIPRHKEFGTRALGRKFHVTQKAISKIINNKTWQKILN